MSRKRTDIHRPSAIEFDPEHYEFRGAFDLYPEWPDTFSGPERIRVINECIAEGYSFHGAAHGMGQCSHCGANIRYAALMLHPSTHCMLWIGETCLNNRFSLSKSAFKALRESSRLNRERKNKAERIAAALDAMDTETRQAYDWALTPESNYIARDIASKIERYAEPLTEKQADFLLKLHSEALQRDAQKAERARQVEAGEIASCPTGKHTITGTILSVKRVENDFGSCLKALVETVGGFRVFGTVPSSLQDGTHELKGSRVEFSATLEPKQGDPTFGFYSRPTKARFIEQETAVGEI